MSIIPMRPVEKDRQVFVAMSQMSWVLTLLLLCIVVGIVLSCPLGFRAEKLQLNALTFAVFTPLALVYTYFRYDPMVAGTADAVALLSAYTSIAAVYTYTMTYLSADTPFWDPRFEWADHALGLDWRSYLVWLDHRPTLAWLFNRVYLSIFAQASCLVLLLPLCGHHGRLQV